MGNLIPSNNNDDNLDFNPTKLPGCKIWLDAADESTLFTTDYQGSATVADNFVPTSISGCSSWYDSSDSSTLYNTSAGPVTAVSSPTGISGCSLWLDAADSNSLYISDAGPVATISSPMDISGCQGWWDASDLTSMFQDSAQTTPVTSNDNPVAVLRDKSGANIHAIQSSSTNSRPLYKTNVPSTGGKSALYFDGVDDFLLANRPASSNHTILAVLYPTVTLTGAASPISINYVACFHPFNGDIHWFASDTGNYLTSAYGFDQFPQIIGWSNNSNAIVGYKNSNITFSGNAEPSVSTGAGLQIGRRDAGYAYFTGYICEIVYYNKVLSLSERASIEQYFTNKWGIAAIHGLSTSSSPVGYVGDKSGNNRHFVQPDALIRPTKSSSQSVSFNGTSQWMRMATASSFANQTTFLVFSRNGTNQSIGGIFGYRSDIVGLPGLTVSDTHFIVAGSSPANGSNISIDMQYNPSASFASWVNGLSDVYGTTGLTLDPTNFSINNRNIVSFNTGLSASGTKMIVLGTEAYSTSRTYGMELCEVIVYNTQLSLTDRARVEKYLAQKWSVTDNHVISTTNGSIGYWGDKSGNNRNAIQSTKGYRPTRSGTINSLPAITFDGADDHFLIGDLSAAFPNFGEVYIVFEPNNANSYELYQTIQNYLIYRYAGGNTSQFGAFTTSRSTGTAFGVPTNGIHITTMRADASSMTVRLDGSVLWTQSGLGYNGGNYHAIGYCNQGTGTGTGGLVMNGKIVEVITYNRDIGSENRAKVEQYLSKKWGIDRNLHKASKNIGDKIGYVKDKGTEKTYLYQLNHDNRPKIGTLSNKKAIDFTQSSINSYLQSPSLNTNNHEFSFFVVYSVNNTNSTLFTLGVQNQLQLISKYAGNTIAYGGSNRLFYDNTPYQLSVPKIESILKTVGGTNSNYTKLYVNGQLATPAISLGLASEMTTSYGWLVLSGYNSPYTFLGHNNFIIGEFIYYNRTLSDQERDLVEKYLYNKWKIDNLTYNISKPTDISNCILWLDANDSSTLFQNPTASNNITADGQSVGYWADKAGGQDVAQLTAAARPTYKINIFKDKPALYFDGGDDLLSVVNRQTTGPCTIIVVARVDSHSGDVSAILAFGDTTGGNSGPGIAYLGGSNYTSFLDGSGAGTTTSSNSIQSILGKPSIITGIYTQARTTNSYLYINGTLQEYYTGTGVALAGSSPRVQIGARTGGGNNTRRMVGYIAECIVYDKVLTDTERAAVENYLSEKWNIGSDSSPYAIGSQIKLHNIKVSNKDAQNWVDRVFQNGGTVGQKTADIVNEFCKKIETAGLRKKFYRLNLFCGNDVTACLTPLYLGPDSNTFYGFRTDSNTGFIGNNYDEKNGLIANGGNGVYLLTGLTLSGAGLSDTGHMAFYQNQFNIDTNPYTAGSRPSIGAGNSYIILQGLQGSSYITAIYGAGNGVASAYYGGLFIVNRDSSSSLKTYEQGILLGEDTTTVSIPDQSSQVGIFTSTNGSVATGANYYYAYMKGYSVGKNMNSSEVSAYNSIMENFQQSLGRGLSTRASAQFASVTNEDARSWIDAVYANNGTVSTSTALAVNNFCNSIDAAGLRDKMYRLNLFCGNSLNSCLVPLYRGSSRFGMRYGNTKDTNISLDGFGYYANSDNFNYVENQGLLGNTQEIAGNSYVSRRYLNTGFITGNVSSLNNNLHYAAYSKDLTNGGYAMGANDGAGIGFSLQMGLTGYNVGVFANSLLNVTNTSTTRNFPTRKGLYVGNYYNYILNFYEGRGNIVGQRDLTTTYPITPAPTSPVGIFCENRATVGIALFNYLERLQGYSIGSSLTATDVQNYYDIMQTFQAALSRAQQTTLSSTFDSITNADTRDWLTRVYENGATVSLTTATAVQNFCNTIDSAGLRSKFFRLNLFCGDNLNAATVPLYRGQSLANTQYGYIIDINTNFISSDYNESGSFAGIKGNGSNKRLDTGLGTDYTNNASMSFGAFIAEPTSVAFSAYLGVYQNTDTDATTLYYRDGFTRGLDGVTFYSLEPTNSTLTGHHVFSRTASNSFFQSWNGVSGSTRNAVASNRGSDGFIIHATNNNGTPAYYSDGRISMYHIGLGLTTSEATVLYNAINAFNATMGRTRPSSTFTSLTNEDAKVWVDNVYYNGGTVSSTTANLVNTFCNSIDTAGLRNKFYRLNLFCGDNLNASLVPVYRGPNKTLVYGGVKTDTNNNFVSADYSENSGLIGNGSSKWLDTALPQNYSASRHLGCVVSKLGTLLYRNYMGAKANTAGYVADTRLTAFEGTATTSSFVGANDAGQLSVAVLAQITEKTLLLASSSISEGTNKIYSDASGSYPRASYSNTNTTTLAIFAQKVGETNTAASHTDARLSIYTIGTDLTDTEVSTLTTIVDAFNDGLNRGKPSSTFTSVTNSDAKTWINRVYTNGGTVSSTTANAINTFCNSIDSAGLRNKFYRLNLFCGSNLNAALTPLYTRPSTNVDNYGNYKDTNFNFTALDYSESGSNVGLQGDGNKYLDTGLLPSYLPISNRHLYVEEKTLPGDYHTSIGIRYSGDAIAQSQAFYVYRDSSNKTSFAFAEGLNLLTDNHTPCQLLCSNYSAGAGKIYRNGSPVGSGTGFSVSSGYPNGTIIVFGLREIYENAIVSKSTARIASYSLGLSLNDTEAGQLYSIVSSFNISMNR